MKLHVQILGILILAQVKAVTSSALSAHISGTHKIVDCLINEVRSKVPSFDIEIFHVPLLRKIPDLSVIQRFGILLRPESFTLI